jgi:hypothetical protein
VTIAYLIPTPGKHGQRDGDRDIDPNLAYLYFALKSACSCARLCEDGGTVAILVGVDDLYSVVECISVQNGQYWSKYLLSEIRRP